jgi:tetratricopeptide (TPR) repeat protein
MSKKKPYRKRRKRKAKPEDPTMPDPRAMEKMTADLGRMLSDQEFDSIDEAKAYIEELIFSGEPIPPVSADSPIEEAQGLMYEAWDASGSLRLELARQALDISEDCADAWVLLAEEAAGSVHEARVFYDAGVRAGERALGPKAFEKYAGHFWGFMETRPYMRARAGLANSLWQLGRKQEAVEHYLEMLGLNPGDNQGIRYVLATCLLELGADDELEQLLDKYDDVTADWQYTRALFLFRSEGGSTAARKQLLNALSVNPHVPTYLLGQKPLPVKLPSSVGFGDKSEAVSYAAVSLHLWRQEEVALDWLQRISKAA